MPKCLYVWRTSPEITRLVAVLVLTYVVQVASQYLANDFADWSDWRKALVAFLVGGIQFVGSRLLAAVPPAPTPPTRITPTGPARDEGGFRET